MSCFFFQTFYAMKKSFSDLISSEIPVLVDFTAAWCGPCKMMAPVLEKVKQEIGDQVRIVKIDVDANPAAAGKMGVMGVPTFVLFQRGKELWRHTGMIAQQQLLQELQRFASSQA